MSNIGKNECDMRHNFYIKNELHPSQQSRWNKTVAHELGHIRWAIVEKKKTLLWNHIREISPGKFDLRDGQGVNIHAGCGCSAGSGHEKYNPENCNTCSWENGF